MARMTRRFSLPPSADQLGQSLVNNLRALFAAMASSLHGELVESDALSMHHTFPNNWLFKGVWSSALDAGSADAAIDRAMAWFQARKAPLFLWWTAPPTEPADLGQRLLARGFVPVEALRPQPGLPGMVLDLEYVDESPLQRTPRDFTIAEASSEADLHAFKRVFCATYGVPEADGQAWVDATLHAGIEHSPWRIHVGRIRSEAVACAISFIGAGVASIYCVATLPSARKRGIGAAITLQPLLQARDRGLRHAVLTTSEQGLRVYERIGFQQIPTRIQRYLWRAA